MDAGAIIFRPGLAIWKSAGRPPIDATVILRMCLENIVMRAKLIAEAPRQHLRAIIGQDAGLKPFGVGIGVRE